MKFLNENKLPFLPPIPQWIKQGIKFFIVGILNTAVDYSIYFILTRWVPFFANQLVLAKAISYPAGTLNSFIWNKNWTFKSEDGYFNLGTLIFFLTNLVGWGINSSMMYAGLNFLHLPELVTLLASTGVVLLWNFLISKFVVFRK